MFKKKFKGALLASALLVFSATTVVGLSSCNNGGGETDKKEDEVTAVVITNKEELTNVWEFGQPDRKISIEVTPNTLSAATLINNGKIKIESSNTDAVTVTGTMLHAQGVGTSTITVSAGDFKDTVEVTIKEKTVIAVSKLADVLKDAAAQVSTSDYKKYTEKTYRVKGVIVANNGKSDVVFYDGETYGFVYNSEKLKKLPVGTTVFVEGGLCNNYGVLQFGSKALIEEVTEASEKVAMPTANKFTTKDFNEYYDLAIKNNSKLVDVNKPTPNNYIEFTGTYTGKDDNKVTLSAENGVEPKDANVSIAKASSVVQAEFDKIPTGAEVKVTGAILGYNSKYKYFTVVPEKVEKLKEVVSPTEFTFAAKKATIKTYESTELEVTNTPAEAGGDVEFTVTAGKDIVKLNGNKVYGLKAGKATIAAKNKTFNLDAKATIDVTVTGEALATYEAEQIDVATFLTKLDGLTYNADNKTNKIFKVRGIVSGAVDTDVYGNVTLTDEKDSSKSFKTFGCAADWTYFNVGEDGYLSSFVQAKKFNTDVLGKLFKNGDVVELYIAPYKFVNSKTQETSISYYAAFSQKLEDAKPAEPVEFVKLDSYKVTGEELSGGLALSDTYENKAAEIKGAKVNMSNGHLVGKSLGLGGNKDSQWGKGKVSVAELKAIDSTAAEDTFKLNDKWYASLSIYANITKAHTVSVQLKNSSKAKDGKPINAYLLQTTDNGKTYTKVAEMKDLPIKATELSTLKYTLNVPTNAAFSVVVEGTTVKTVLEIHGIDIQAKAKAD